MRESGILMPIFSLPSAYGIGCFSKEAYQFINMLKSAGQTKWQILPLGPTGYGDSPYQSFSTFAGNPYFIDLESLIREGLLTKQECEALDFGDKADSIDYGKLYVERYKILELAFDRFKPSKAYQGFVQANAWWLEDYCLYSAIKDSFHGAPWQEWDESLRKREEKALADARIRMSREMDFYRFQQYQFLRQWNKLHAFAKMKGIEIIGDLPIYVALDSADAWANPELFQFDQDNIPTAVAGCPPDAFTADGQLWGNPLYDWEYHRKTDYVWWLQRIAYTFTLFDVVRIDHFRGFDEYYAVPFGRTDARIGEWLPGPASAFFYEVKEKLGDLKIIAEDLGFLTDSVTEMLEDSGYPGMKILQFAFGSGSENDSLPHNHIRNCVVYTGTHDNDTTRGWLKGLSKEEKKHVKEYLRKPGLGGGQVAWKMIDLGQASIADLCVIPLQDYLNLDTRARINTPSTLGGNWQWRMKKGQLTPGVLKKIHHVTEIYGRLPAEPIA